MVAGKGDKVIHRQSKGRQVAQRSADDPEYDVESQALLDDGGTKAALFVLICEIDVSHLLEAAPFFFGEERFGKPLGVFGRERWVIFPDRCQGPVAAPSRWVAGGQVNIRAIVLDANGEVFIDMSKDFMFGHRVRCGAPYSAVMALWKP